MSHRRPPHALLRAKRRRVRKQSTAIAKRLRQAGGARHPAGLAPEVHQLRASLQGLRREVVHSGGGTSAKHVAEALGQLDRSLAKLASASGHANPTTALNTLAEGMRALEGARRAAKAAGSAWPL